jgi:hypothetical protein
MGTVPKIVLHQQFFIVDHAQINYYLQNGGSQEQQGKALVGWGNEIFNRIVEQ